jgi:hypothetical protein
MKLISGTGGTSPGDFNAGSITLNTWHQIGFIWTSTGSGTSTQQVILDGSVVNSRSIGIGTPASRTSDTFIGKATQCWPTTPFNGFMANAQVYNTSLDVNQIQSLYLEGIGGAPVSPQYVVGWWPLNGDTKDYSGGNNNGVPTAITFVSQYGK